MSRTEAVLTVFLASPSDVADERNRLEDAIAEWNRTWARNLGLRLELLRWENDAYADIGDDAQEVINRQIPQDYDLFVGVMWSRFGTPTGRAGSGTAEEFARALSRYRASSTDVSILFYFKDAPLPPSKLDPSQLQKVQEFKTSLGSEGVLHWSFTDTDQFEKLVSLHITRHVQNWRQHRHSQHVKSSAALPNSTLTEQVAPPQATERTNDEDDDGYLDLLEVFTERNAELGEIAARLSAAQSELTARIAQGTSDLQALAASPQGATPAQARRLIGKVADEMLLFTNRVVAEVPLFRAATNSSMNALTRVATLSAEFDIAQLRSAKTASFSLLAAIAGARESTIDFRATTAGLPRITKELNIAKRAQGAALDTLVAEFENAERLLSEALTLIDTLLQDAGTAR